MKSTVNGSPEQSACVVVSGDPRNVQFSHITRDGRPILVIEVVEDAPLNHAGEQWRDRKTGKTGVYVSTHLADTGQYGRTVAVKRPDGSTALITLSVRTPGEVSEAPVIMSGKRF